MKSPFVWGKGGRAMTPEEVDRERELVALARAKMGDTSPVGHWTQGATRVVDALGAVLREKRTNKAEAAGLASADEAIAALLAGRGGAGYAAPSFTASSSGAPAPAAAPQGPEYPIGVDALPQSPTTPGGYSLGTEIPAGVDPALAAKYAIPEEVKNGIFAGESGGDYDALFGFQNRPGGKFQNVKLTDMTIDEALNFAAPSGEYGQTVKGQIGRVATPMGAYQIVGTTLKAAKDGLGLTGNEVMTPELQDALGGWILANQGTGAWEGYKGPRDGYTPASGGAVTMSTSGPSGGYGGGGTGGVDIASLLALQKNPWVAKKYGGVVDALMGQQFSRQNALWEQQQKMADPMYQAQLAELTAPKVSDYDARAAAAAQYGLQPGTPEYQRFVLAGDVAVPGGGDPFAGTKEIGGVLYGPDGQGGFVPLITPPSDGAVPLTDPAERAKWGIPPTDTRPYAVKPGEVPKVVGGDGVTVNNNMGGGPEMGKLSTDYGYVLDESGQPRIDPATGLPTAAPVPGSPAWIEAQRLATKGERKDNQTQLKLGTTLESINLNLGEIENGGLPVTGLIGDARRTWLGRALTGDSAVDFGNRTNQITDQAALAEVQNMRDNSPTGGAVGSLTDSERVAIGNSVTAINNSTSPEEYARAAKAYRKLALDIAYGEGTWELDENGQPVLKGAAGGGGDTPTGNKTSNGVQWSIEP